jgi:hypothetical protein
MFCFQSKLPPLYRYNSFFDIMIEGAGTQEVSQNCPTPGRKMISSFFPE